MSITEPMEKAATGIEGLDAVLEGGFPKRQSILIQGGPGTGKTTLALQFLLEGKRRGETGLYISLLQGRSDIERIARSHGWSLEGIGVETLMDYREFAGFAHEQTVFHPAHVELGETIGKIRALVERTAPARLVFDSISELQVLSDTLLRSRQQVAELKQLLSQCTALYTIAASPSAKVEEFEYILDGLIRLRQQAPVFGLVRRSLEVVKMRGMAYRSGHHDYSIERGGLRIYPRLQAFHEPYTDEVPTEGDEDAQEVFNSGVPGLDALIREGFRGGTAALIQGAAGVGKSCLVTLYAHAAAREGKRSSIFLFDESVQTYLLRARSIGLDLAPFIKEGLVAIRRISVGEVSPGELSEMVRIAIERDKIDLLAIDSLSGYLSAVADEVLVLAQLHELLAYTGSQGVLTFLTVAEHGLIGAGTPEPAATTILADAVLLLRFFESQGEIRRAISVFKKRYGDHERTIREMSITPQGIRIGEQLMGFTGVLTGNPVFVGAPKELIKPGE
jgi:circadian clock protein KaiC